MRYEPVFYREYSPSPELAPYVRCYAQWQYNLDEKVCLPGEQTPFGCPYLTVNYRGKVGAEVPPFENKDFTNNHIAGQLLKHYHNYHSGNVGFFGIFFYPTSVHYLFREEMRVFTQKAWDIETMNGASGRRLVDRITSTDSSGEMIDAAEQFLKEKLQNASPKTDEIDQAAFIIRKNPTIALDKVGQHLRISSRSLRRRFKEKVGIGPKYYLRICRFHQALRLSYQYPDADLHDLSFLSGYYDQSHFMKDFGVFTGKTPYDYFKRNNRSPELGGILR